MGKITLPDTKFIKSGSKSPNRKNKVIKLHDYFPCYKCNEIFLMIKNLKKMYSKQIEFYK